MKKLKSLNLISSLCGYLGQKFWKAIVMFEINTLKLTYLQSLVQKQKSLNLGLGMSNLSILEQEFENTIVILEILASNLSNCKVWCETKSPLPYSRWAISGLLADGRGQKGRPISRICQTYPTMMSVGTVILYLKSI